MSRRTKSTCLEADCDEDTGSAKRPLCWRHERPVASPPTTKWARAEKEPDTFEEEPTS